MDVRQFGDKLRTVARHRGLTTAVRTALGDILSKTLQPVGLGRFGTLVWESSADIILVLDGTRVDALEAVAPEYHWLPAEVPSTWSVGSSSSEWYGHTFSPGARSRWNLGAVGVVSANPHTAKESAGAAGAPSGSLPLGDSDLARVEEVWRAHWGVETSDGHLDVVRPAVLTDLTIDLWRRREEVGISRILAHYMQPHTPFRSRPEWFGVHSDLLQFGEANRVGRRDPWLRVRDWELPKQEFWDAYVDNLRWVLDSVETVLTNVDADVLLTSDHGNGLGEWGVWGHPACHVAPILRQVPWVVVRGEDRGTHDPDTGEMTERERGDVDERLRSLGYLQ